MLRRIPVRLLTAATLALVPLAGLAPAADASVGSSVNVTVSTDAGPLGWVLVGEFPNIDECAVSGQQLVADGEVWGYVCSRNGTNSRYRLYIMPK
jgi:hypothetical protein